MVAVGTDREFFIDGKKLEPMTDFTFTGGDIGLSNDRWTFYPSDFGTITGTFNIKWKNKIDKALGLTHYAKNGKLYRK